MKKRILFLFVALSIIYNAKAQVVITPSVTCTSTTLHGTVSTATSISIDLGSDDTYSGVIPIGFNFSFYGRAYDSCLISDNGVLSFDKVKAGTYNGWYIDTILKYSGIAAPDIRNLIAAPWCDMEFSYGGTCKYATIGIAPNRKFIVSFCRVALFNFSNKLVTSEIVLYETSNLIDIHISRKDTCILWNGGHAIVGVKDIGAAATTAPGRDYPAVWTASNESWRFTPSDTTYSVSTLPYAPYPFETTTIKWFDSSSGALLGTGNSVLVADTVTTTYMACAYSCSDSFKTYVTISPVKVGLCSVLPSTAIICTGDSVYMHVITTDTGLTYQWYKNGVIIAGATNYSYTTYSAGNYSVVVANSFCQKTLVGTTVTANDIGLCTLMPATGTICTSDSIYMHVVTYASGLSYQWLTDGVPIIGATNYNYTTYAAGNFSVIVTNSTCQKTLVGITIIGNYMGLCSVLPATGTICPDDSVYLHVITSSSSLTYQWLKDSIVIPGATDFNFTTYTPGRYSVIVANSTCVDTLKGTTVIALTSPVIHFIAANYLYTDYYASYQWYKDGTLITGATSYAYFAPTPVYGDYTVNVTYSNGCSKTSATYTIPNNSGVVNVGINNNISVSPNPASSTVFIKALQEVNVKIMSADGRKVIEQNNTKEINIKNLANGMYIIMIYDKDNFLLKTDKLIKNTM